MIVYSVNYVNSYGTGSVSSENAVQYVITSTMAYFGFAVTFFMGGYIIQKLTKLELSNFTAHSENTESAGNRIDMQEIIIEKPLPTYPSETELQKTSAEEEPEEAKPQSHKSESISSSMIKDIFENK